MVEDSAALALCHAVVSRGEFNHLRYVVSGDFRPFRRPHHFNDFLEAYLIDGGLYRVLHFEHERSVIRRKRGGGIQAVIFASLIATSDVIAACGCVVYDHAVAANKPINERLNGHAPHADFAVGDEDAALHHVAGDNFCFQSWVDDLDVHTFIGHFATLNARVLDVGDDRKNGLCDFVVVDSAIALRKERSGRAVKGSHHARGGRVIKPTVDVCGEQIGV